MEHVVRPGETLSGIAHAHGVELEQLLELNRSIKDPDVVLVGDAIRLPRQARLAESTSTFRGRSAPPPSPSQWHVMLKAPPSDAPFWAPTSFTALAERRDPAPRAGRRRTFRTSQMRKRWIAERQEAAQTAVDALPSPTHGAFSAWRALEPLRVLARAAGAAYGLAAHITDAADFAYVSDGDTLWDHAEEAGLSIRELQRGNRLRSDVIRTGSKLRYTSAQAPGPVTLLHSARRAWGRLLLPVRLTPPLEDPAAYMSSAFGPRFGVFHSGMDISSEIGEPVLAAADGVVTFTGVDGPFGLRVQISHGGAVTTSYAHCASLLRAPGERVARGDPIGAVGETGSADGPHLHFEVRRFGQAIDPYWVMEGMP